MLCSKDLPLSVYLLCNLFQVKFLHDLSHFWCHKYHIHRNFWGIYFCSFCGQLEIFILEIYWLTSQATKRFEIKKGNWNDCCLQITIPCITSPYAIASASNNLLIKHSLGVAPIFLESSSQTKRNAVSKLGATPNFFIASICVMRCMWTARLGIQAVVG